MTKGPVGCSTGVFHEALPSLLRELVIDAVPQRARLGCRWTMRPPTSTVHARGGSAAGSRLHRRMTLGLNGQRPALDQSVDWCRVSGSGGRAQGTVLAGKREGEKECGVRHYDPLTPPLSSALRRAGAPEAGRGFRGSSSKTEGIVSQDRSRGAPEERGRVRRPVSGARGQVQAESQVQMRRQSGRNYQFRWTVIPRIETSVVELPRCPHRQRPDPACRRGNRGHSRSMDNQSVCSMPLVELAVGLTGKALAILSQRPLDRPISRISLAISARS